MPNNILNSFKIILCLMFLLPATVMSEDALDKTELNSPQKQISIMLKQAFAFHNAGDLESALPLYTKVIDLDPENVDAYFARGNLYAKNENDRAILDYQKALSLQPNSAKLHGMFGWFYIKKGQFKKARPFSEKAYELDPKFYAWSFNLAHLSLLENDYQMAKIYYQKGFKSIKKEIEYDYVIADLKLFIKNGWQVEATKLTMDWMNKTFLEYKQLKEKLIELNKKADLLFDEQKYTEAEPYYQQINDAIKKTLGEENYHTSVSMNKLADLYLRTGRYGEAEVLLKKVLNIRKKLLGLKHPDTVSVRVDLMLLYVSQKRFDEAEDLSVNKGKAQ